MIDRFYLSSVAKLWCECRFDICRQRSREQGPRHRRSWLAIGDDEPNCLRVDGIDKVDGHQIGLGAENVEEGMGYDAGPIAVA